MLRFCKTAPVQQPHSPLAQEHGYRLVGLGVISDSVTTSGGASAAAVVVATAGAADDGEEVVSSATSDEKNTCLVTCTHTHTSYEYVRDVYTFLKKIMAYIKRKQINNFIVVIL